MFSWFTELPAELKLGVFFCAAFCGVLAYAATKLQTIGVT